MPSSRFRTMYRDLGLNRAGVAQLLRVSERTIHNWETGHHQVPYSAYKLVRLMTYQEFPDPAWAGWHLTAGVLYSPEGHGFKPKDSNWWSLLCRKAAMFNELYAKIYKKIEITSIPNHESIAKPKGEVLVTPHNIPIYGTGQQNYKVIQRFNPDCQNVKYRILKLKSTNLISKGVK
jgi:hypothetical protein